jgi:tetratricopeptide (TPR) repeat protein
MPDLLERLTSVLGDRYAIESEIGRGGMAVVFLAEDLKHHRNVALKVLHPELTATLGAERFLHEIEIVAGLHHPHILPLYDSGEADGFLYYVMPYVEGESLRDRLVREKQLAIDDALQVAREVADALSYAHAHGVVHRDIKPENIMLESGHAVVADFGIARAVDAAGGERLTETGIAIGTPAYMSPEQAGGEKDLDGRSDLYSLGCVLHEMLAGQPPFTGPTVESLVHQHLSAEPPSVTTIRPSVPGWIAAALERSLAKTPADRFNPVAQFGEAIAPRGGMTPTDTVPVDRRAKRWWMMAGGVLGIAAIVAVIAIVGAMRRGGSVTLDPERIVVAVFRNETGDPSLDQLGSRASQWITQGLQQAAVRVVPWDMALQAWQYVQSEADAGRVRDPTRALAEEAGAGTVVSGVVYLENDSLEIHVSVTDAERGEPLGAIDPVRGPRESPREVIADMRQRVMGFLSITFDERINAQASSVAQPPSFEAYREFDQGLELYLRSGGPAQEAIPHFHRAFALDTTFVTPLFYTIFTHINNDKWAQADSLERIIEGYRGRLSEYDQHWLGFLRALVDGDNAEALRDIRRAAELAPGSKAVYNRAYQAVGLNRPQEAIDALLSLDPERGPMRGWPTYFTHLIRAYLDLEQPEKALEAARKRRELYGDDAVDLAYEAFALAALGRVEEVNALVNEIIALPEQGLAQGSWIRRIAVYLRRYGHIDATHTNMDRAIQWYEARVPETQSSAEWLYQYAVALYVANRCDEAYSVAKPLAEEVPENSWYWGIVGILAVCRGDREEALEISQRLDVLDRPYLHGANTGERSAIAGALGDGENAVAFWSQAMAEGRRMLGPYDWRWIAFERISDYPPFQELTRPKG